MAKRKTEYKGFIPVQDEIATTRFVENALVGVDEEAAGAAFVRGRDTSLFVGVRDDVANLWHVRCRAIVCGDGLVGIEILGRSVGIDGNPLNPDIRRFCGRFSVSVTHPIYGKPDWQYASESLSVDIAYCTKAMHTAGGWMYRPYNDIEKLALLSMHEIVDLIGVEAA